jgi:hypothetical protein
MKDMNSIYVAQDRTYLVASSCEHGNKCFNSIKGGNFLTTEINISFSRRNAINHLKPRGNYLYHLLYQSLKLNFVFVGII